MEKVFYIDLKGAKTKEELHEILKETLPLPDYYGGNLDALYDVLTEMGDDWNLIFYNTCDLAVEEPDYFGKLCTMADRAVREADNLKIRFFP